MAILTLKGLQETGLSLADASLLFEKMNALLKALSPESAWQQITRTLLNKHHPFPLHLYIFTTLFPEWPEVLDAAPVYQPTAEEMYSSNLAQWMRELNINSVKIFHEWTTTNYLLFWKAIIEKLNIVFQQSPNHLIDAKNIEKPIWFPGAKLNIVDSCFTADPQKTALIYLNDQNQLCHLSYGALNEWSNQIANSLINLKIKTGDSVAIIMPMDEYAVAIYLAIIKMGGIVVSIAESFSADEIAVRLKISRTTLIFTRYQIHRLGKTLPLYEKIRKAEAPKTIVLQALHDNPLRPEDLTWESFLIDDKTPVSISCEPMSHCNILFSSGTTGTPKAIPWNHTTPIKAASDAYLHQNIQNNDIIAWPTSLGWMMGPWLVFAAFINQATIALFNDAPHIEAFCQFIEKAKVTILGVVPSLVAQWRANDYLIHYDWTNIKLCTSTGECSNPEDMFYLMSQIGYKPIIEYCGGTEIGGAYISSTVCENNYPSVFTTPTMGLNFVLMDDSGQPADLGEVALVSPSIGLSTELLNADHHQVYFANMPILKNSPLRRHGDLIQRLPSGYYTALGRLDDTMNLGGIKISAVEIERVLTGIPYVLENAAIAIAPHRGPSLLIIYAVIDKSCSFSKKNIQQEMQRMINLHLNPLFKIHDVILVNELPKTASNKIMRRLLRDQIK